MKYINCYHVPKQNIALKNSKFKGLEDKKITGYI